MNVRLATRDASTLYCLMLAMILCLLCGCGTAPPLECPEPAQPPPSLLEPLKPTTRQRMREIVTSVPRSTPSLPMQS
jgi:hypothetical protein